MSAKRRAAPAGATQSIDTKETMNASTPKNQEGKNRVMDIGNKTIANEHVAQGFHVTPLHPSTKRPARKEWQTPGTSYHADSHEDVDRIWGEHPEWLVGIVPQRGLFVFDIDGQAGFASLRKLEELYGELPVTRTVTTTSGEGEHRYFKYDTSHGRIVRCAKRGLRGALNTKDELHIDIKGVGGQVVAPGSRVVYPDGRPGVSQLTVDVPIVDAPTWLIDALEFRLGSFPEQGSDIEPINDARWATVLDALPHVSANAYDDWLRIGMALHSTGRGEACDAWDEWSRDQPGYDGREAIDDKWRSFSIKLVNGQHARFATVLYEAKENGWREPIGAQSLEKLADALASTGSLGGADDVTPSGDGPSNDEDCLVRTTDYSVAHRIATKLDDTLHRVRGRQWVQWDGDAWRARDAGSARDCVVTEMHKDAIVEGIADTEKAVAAKEKCVEELREASRTVKELAGKLSGMRAERRGAGDSDELSAAIEDVEIEVADARDEKAMVKKKLTAISKKIDDGGKGIIAEFEKNQKVTGVFSIFVNTDKIATDRDEWDANREHLATPDGVVDLNTGEYIDDPKGARCSRHTAVAPAPIGSTSPRWLKFLDEVFLGDQEAIDFLQWYLGYSATGYTRLHKLVMAHGEHGRNGKGTLFSTVSRVMGAYAESPDSILMTMDGANRHGTFLASLDGCRLAVLEEVEQKAEWNLAQVKKLTAGDEITANFMREDPFSFIPQYSFVVVANNLPSFNTVDKAGLGRFLILNFPADFSKSAQPDLKDQLYHQEAAGILRWIIDGAKMYLQDPTREPPKKVLSDTEHYTSSADVFAEWLGETMDAEPKDDWEVCDIVNRRPTALFRHYRDFCRMQGKGVISKDAFDKQMLASGFGATRRRVGGNKNATFCMGPIKINKANEIKG